MEIIEKDFKLKPVDESSSFFDLELLYIVNKGKETERKEFKNAGYGLTLQTALKNIAHYKICCNHPEEVITLKTYFKEYKEALNALRELLC